jgi:hypothetical protein
MVVGHKAVVYAGGGGGLVGGSRGGGGAVIDRLGGIPGESMASDGVGGENGGNPWQQQMVAWAGAVRPL